ncbi:HAMP domain-containing sensor histidine kinase [Carnobacterium gallinarum]|uniref:HAMP domain-containing sensor histidine kinase n=1 Tax=Carnobacterium gallinarum TaxID=2749 RepID=UPI000555BB1A|nr:ATP-binding protein [Carnobacterium gallinarum]
MTKLNSIVFRTWMVTMGIVAFCLISSTLIYSSIYQKHVEKVYVDEFNESISNVEKLVMENPEFLLKNPDKFEPFDTHLFFTIEYNGEKREFFNNYDKEIGIDKTFINRILSRKDVVKSVKTGVDDEIHGHAELAGYSNSDFILSIKHFSYNGKKGVLYSYGDLSFLTKIANQMSYWTLSIFLMLLLLSILFYYFLKLKIGDPLSKMRDIAFEYAKNDFTHQAPVTSKDELLQLALAMNKMGKSLESIGMATRQEKELLAHILSSMTTGVLFYNRDKDLLMSNPMGEEFLQQWRRSAQYTNSDTIPYILDQKINEIIESTVDVTFELQLDDYYYKINLVPLYSEDMITVRGVLASVQDMTKERRLDTMRVDFISNVSHELRTPLVMIRGYSEAILDDVAETREEKHEMAKIIWEESERMSKMVNEMLDLSRMEAGYIELQCTDVDLYGFVRDLMSRFNQIAQSGEVTLSFEIQKGMDTYYMDEDKMSQVLFNLTNNAIRHTIMANREDGEVRISVRLDRIMDELLIEVLDNGTGIPKKDLPYIFERFFKVDKSRVIDKQNQTGTGIGLSIVKNIVEEHEGYMEVQSEENVSTSFIIHLPYQDKIEK